MDLLTTLRQNEAMLDLADRASRLAADRRRKMRSLRFHVEQEFGLALDSLLGLTRPRCPHCLGKTYDDDTCYSCLVVLDSALELRACCR